MRLLALLAVRDDVRWLPGFFASVGPHVDGVLALDDGSTDGSDRYLAERGEVLELIRVPPDRPAWDEIGNYRRLVDAAVRHGADWVLSLDADERVEQEFRTRLERALAVRPEGVDAYAVRLRELWDSPLQFRDDGIWGRKTRLRIFRLGTDLVFEDKALHGHKVPVQCREPTRHAVADLELYHLRMIAPEDRAARRRRYEEADPDGRWQPAGYAYLTDTTGLSLRTIDPARAYAGAEDPIARAATEWS